MITVTKEEIDKIFKDAQNQADALIQLYTIAHPNWNKIKKLKGYPKASRELNEYLFKKFIEYDQDHHPEVLSGGLWLDKGFSTDDKLKGMIIKPAKEIL